MYRRAAVLCAVFLTAAGVHAQEVWLGVAYDLREAFTVAGSEVRGYVARPGTSGEGRFAFRVHGARGADYAYRVDLRPADPGNVRLAACVHDLKKPGQNESPPEPPRVATRLLATSAATYEAARRLVEDAEKAAGDWEAHQAFLPEALSATPETAHEGWRKIAADLERAREKHPEHLGILRDLIVAYTRLLPFEKDTARGMNLCSLIPQRVAEFEIKAGELSGEENRTLRRARALLYFHIGLYPLARAAIDRAGPDPDLDVLRKALEAVGQDEFTEVETFTVPGERTSCRVTVYQSKGTPADLKLPSHQWFFVTRLGEGGAPTPIWCTLSRQTLTEAPRYYLYGNAGSMQKLLKIYGHRQPGYDEVKEAVGAVIAEALKKG